MRDGVRIACRDWGGAEPPVVLLHGLAGHAGVRWSRFVVASARGKGAS
ncbi:hypothetical protein AB0D86_46310 [Streptomyces sp. NPDC048324]